MFIYLQWFKNGQNQIQAFHKVDKATDYVINQIETYIANDSGGPYKRAKKVIPYGGGYPAVPAHPAQPAAPIGFDDLLDAPPAFNVNAHFNPQPVAIAPAPRNMFAEAPQAERKISAEMIKLQAHMEIARKNRTLDNALLAIKLYEEYAKYVLDNESAIHTLEDIRVAE